MSLTRLFLKRPTLVFVLVALMSFAGVMSTMTIVKQLFPNVSQPTITISVAYNGASVTEMRDDIVAPIEQNLAGTTDLQSINSTVQQGQATIVATFILDSNIATDLSLSEKAVLASEKQLPVNITPPVVSIRDPSESTVITLGLFSKKLSPGQLSLEADNVVLPLIEQIPGISFAQVSGDVTPAYEIEVDPTKLLASGLTLNDVITSVTNNNQRVPGGIAYEPNRETTIDVRGDIQNLESVRNLPITPPAPSAVVNQAGATSTFSDGLNALPGSVNAWTASDSVWRVNDVAKVIASSEPQRRYAQINGTPGLFVQIQKSSTASEVDAANNVLKQLPLIERKFPAITFKVINTQSTFTQQQIDIVTRTLMEGIFLTGIAMIFFLRSWRNALVVCVSIPTSLAIAITVMKLLGLTLDTISLLAMSLVIGILVDDSTVVLENIERHFTELKQSPEDAAVEGREEIGAAAVVITLVDVVVFFPIAFIQGQVGRNLTEFAIVVVISTLTSLFVSFTVTPTLAGLWALKSHWEPPKIIDAFSRSFDRLRDWYAHRVLPWGLGNGTIVAAACLISFVVSIAMIPLGFVGEEFVPNTDRGQIFVQLVFPIGTPLAHVRNKVYELEHEIDKESDVAAEGTSAGAYSAAFGSFVLQGNVAQVTVFLKNDRTHPTDWWVDRFNNLARQTAPEADSVAVPSTGTAGGNKQPIDLLVADLTGGDPTSAAEKVLALLKATPGATSVNGSGTLLAPEISIQFDRAKAQALNVSIGDAATAAGAAFGGDVVTQFETLQGLEEVQVIYPLEKQHELDTLRAIPIRAQNGALVHLGDFTDFLSTPTSPLITRTDRNTVIHVNANISPESSLSGVQSTFFRKLPLLQLPPNISVRPAPLGQQDFMNQTLIGLGSSLVVSVILVFLLMVALYNSYRSPFIILFSVPVAAVGAIGALMLTHKTLNLFSLIGTILLVGIATKNGILLVDYANTLRSRGMEKLDAIRQSAYTRFRPIVMTSFSVVAGNIPLALALDPGSGARASLGIVVIGGVISSLVLTLLLVPLVYARFAPAEQPLAAVRPKDR
ncbi:MAG TPA: efflux RND transporter permease subunit [Candidatus Baltobacteraceae bacterium]|jgi:HAE1 family hydrophobic/amphiphilic exporter-1|nr:efflux RND transporter permease subunit [Candidatus Baltobacteraceae bacterium]